MSANIYNIPAGYPFAKTLANALLDETKDAPETLTNYLILLPTRRACRVLQDAFLELNTGTSLLLPRMQPIGDLDEEELSFSLISKGMEEEVWSMPPALPPLKRQILLSQLIQKLHPDNNQAQALKLAQALGHLMDQIYTENLDMADLANLAPLDFADHWQITLKFLEILSEYWPQILEAEGSIDAANRRNRLILRLSKFWQNHPPDFPVIGAGSTGSIPATAKLLGVISNLPNGRIVLPGVDVDLDEKSWNAMDETHPQFGFRDLLGKIDARREDIKNFVADDAQMRALLTREIMRPAETSQSWASLADDKTAKETLSKNLENLHMLECENIREEAETIALLMRETLTTPDKTACLITPDRNLAMRVSSACKRWDINVDDSAGETLKNLPLGIFLRLILDTIQDRFAPQSLLALLKHPFTHIDQAELYNLDLTLRGIKPSSGFDGLESFIKNRDEKYDRIDEGMKERAMNTLQHFRNIFEKNIHIFNVPASFETLLKQHLKIAEALINPEEKSLWSGETGQKASAYFSDLFAQTAELQIDDIADYTATFDHFLEQIQIRPSFGTHPRLQILGQLEARLINADLVILGGLNEKTWPAEPSNDPWMSRPMRKEFGLPSLERGIGLAAHDFVQGISTKNVVITRAEKIGGAPAVPSRWLQRLDAVLDGANITHNHIHPAQNWARAIDNTKDTENIERPAPCPPIELRPTRLSATRIETLLRDPYAIYAQKILKLESLKPLENDIDAATRGSILHKILEKFVDENPKTIPENATDQFVQIAKKEIKTLNQDEHIWSFWWPRLYKTANWVADHERDHRENIKSIHTEAKGEYTINAANTTFTLTAIADRIDETLDGDACIIDYKSGGSYSAKAMQNGKLPQLPIEALILSEGGFKNIAAMPSNALEYWVLKGNTGGTIQALRGDLSDLIAETKDNMHTLIESYFDPSMPYICQPIPDEAPAYNDYEHLERIKEWGVQSDFDSNIFGESDAA